MHKQAGLLNILIFFAQFENSICLKESDLHTPYQLASDPGN